MLSRAYSVKIGVIYGVRFERRKVDKKQTYMKTETCKLYSRDFWIFLPKIIKIDHYNSGLYCFKVGAFFEAQCSCKIVLMQIKLRFYNLVLDHFLCELRSNLVCCKSYNPFRHTTTSVLIKWLTAPGWWHHPYPWLGLWTSGWVDVYELILLSTTCISSGGWGRGMM